MQNPTTGKHEITNSSSHKTQEACLNRQASFNYWHTLPPCSLTYQRFATFRWSWLHPA